MATEDDLQKRYADILIQKFADHLQDSNYADATRAGAVAFIGDVIEEAQALVSPPAGYLETVQATLVAHQRLDIQGCVCGWAELGRSHPAHQVEMLRRAGVLNDPRTVVEWHPYDIDDKAATAPPDDQLVWIREWFYTEGTTVGFFDGSMRLWTGSDDVDVSHWALIPMPAGPTPDFEESDDDGDEE